MTSTIDENEVKKFSDIADEWWSETGKFKPLHKFNPCRISYIRKKIAQHFSRDENSAAPFAGLKIIDIGCGGGLISEPFARMKADVVGVDASERNIAVAKIHAEKSSLNIDYQAAAVEDLIKKTEMVEKFDVVFALEIVEHVADVGEFIRGCAKLVKPGGIMFVATLNRTAKSFLLAKIGAEYIMRWLPKGTHSWQKFLKPSEVADYASQNGLSLHELTGFSYNLFYDSWKEKSNDLDVNYMAMFLKN